MKSKIRNVAPVRKGPTTRDSFNKAARLTYAPDKSLPDGGLLQWNKFIPLTPKKALEILTRDVPKDVKVTLTMDEDGKGEIRFTGPGIDDFYASFDLKKHEHKAEMSFVYKKDRGNGLGRKITRNEIEFFQACGVKKFRVYAGSTTGGYMWARFGYLPDDLKDSEFESDKESIQARYALLRPLLTREERKDLDQAVKLQTKKDMWRIADARIDIGARLKDQFNKAAGLDEWQKVMEDGYEDEAKTEYGGDTAHALEQWVDNGKPVLVGRLLLSGTHWDGTISLSNREQMERVEKFTGGFRYLSLG